MPSDSPADPQPLPIGFSAHGMHCGIKSNPSSPDLSLFASDRPCTTAGVYTQNRVVGAPVVVSRGRTPSGTGRAVVINSGNANACTGQRGLDDAEWMTERVAGELGCAATEVLVCSTGIIGHFLNREALATGFPNVVQGLTPTEEGLQSAARGMMTTDTHPKTARTTVTIGSGSVSIVGVAKGAAMIAPNMATMLGVIMTDAAIEPDAGQQVLASAVDDTFNCISVEGHTSTSDTVLLLANGGSTIDCNSEADRQTLREGITKVCGELARMIIRDAEGAEHFVTLDVSGLPDRAACRTIAKTVCESALVQTAITGNDPNWGRIVSAAGYAGVPFEEAEVSLEINGVRIYEAGTPTEYDEAALSRSMAEGEVHLDLRFQSGPARIRYWTCDLTQEYVRLNSEYTT